MKCFGLILAAVFAAVAFGGPPLALAAAPAAPPAPYSKEQIEKGAKTAPAVVQASGLQCAIANAAFISEGMGKSPDDPKGKDVKITSYEVSCQQGMGYVLQDYAGLPLKIYDCVSLADTPSPCRLPENRDPKAMIGTLVKAAGKTCTVAQERPLGATRAGDRFFEVSCAEGPGYIIKAASPLSTTPPLAEDCARQIGTNLECKYTTKEQIQAALNAKLQALVQASGKTCTISGSREVGADSSGMVYYEVACGPGVGYMLGAKNDQFVRAISCANAAGLGGGCTLTDVTKAESAESGTYTHLATAGGFNCTVGKYRYIGLDSKNGSEVVELQCTNRPDGVIAMFPSDNKGQAKFFDCIAAGGLGETCHLSDPSASYDKYTKALASKGKTSCKVSGAKWLAATTDGNNFIETACSDGLPGWVISQTASGSVDQILTCGQAKAAGVACTLPTNVK